MEFALTDDQRMLQDSVSGVLASVCALDEVRMVADGGSVAAMRDALGELGLAQVMVPEAQGGLGMGLLDAALVQDAMGAAVCPAPFVGNMMASAGFFGADDAVCVEYMAQIASGAARFGAVMSDYLGARAEASLSVKGGVLNGNCLFAMEAATATHILVADRSGAVHVVEAGAAGLSIQALATIDRTRDLSELKFDGVKAVTLSGTGIAERMLSVGRLLLAADSLGAAQVMLDKAVAYAQERKQFGRAIGSFQAVKHMCAEMAAQVEPARALVWHAAHAFDEDMDEADVMICLAKSHLAEVGTFVARTSTEVHGGTGFTDLVGLHYWFKRIGANRQLLGSPERVREDAARLQGFAA
jgi:alkylation response protein AidB-like acyl-CoA dehydrogenase